MSYCTYNMGFQKDELVEFGTGKVVGSLTRARDTVLAGV